jgi:hypothetical protein
VIPALPFLAVPLVAAWARWPRACRYTAGLGALTAVLGVVTPHLVTVGVIPLREYLHNVSQGSWTPTVWTLAFGVPAGIAVHVGTIGAALFMVRRTHAHGRLSVADELA